MQREKGVSLIVLVMALTSKYDDMKKTDKIIPKKIIYKVVDCKSAALFFKIYVV